MQLSQLLAYDSFGISRDIVKIFGTATPHAQEWHNVDRDAGMTSLIRELIRPYRGTIAIILLPMLVETVISLAGPWPLKIIIDNVIGDRKPPAAVDEIIRPMLAHENKLRVAALAAVVFVLIALLGALASYIDNYYTASLANGLRTICECALMITSSGCRSPTMTLTKPVPC
jgi:ABC-type bacteriocin/lantibiotic exporter with double-glycine peptidase domain